MDIRLAFIKNTIQLVLSPTKGWEDISTEQPQPKLLANKCMYPLIVLASLSTFVQTMYHSETYVSYYVIMAAITFVAYFVSYIFAGMLMESQLYKYVDSDPNFLKSGVVVAYGISMLAMVTILCNLIPMNLGLDMLLPLGVALILWKSATYMFVKQSMNLNYGAFMTLAVVVPPIAIQMIFDWILTL